MKKGQKKRPSLGEMAPMPTGTQVAQQEDLNKIPSLVDMCDPWHHRSSGLHCSTCMWFVQKASLVPRLFVLGRCRKHAPMLGGYPVVFDNDWCGDHKMDENKI